MEIIAAGSLIQLANHFKGTQVLSRPQRRCARPTGTMLDLVEIKGQESAKRALEIAAAGGHKSPDGGPTRRRQIDAGGAAAVHPAAAVAGGAARGVDDRLRPPAVIEGGALTNQRPFRAPHHSASMPALVGGGLRAKPGEISLAHNGVLFLDELPEFDARVLDFAAPAAGDRRGRDRPRQPPRHLSGALHAGRPP